MEIAVLGGGHGAYAAAADLTEQGHRVRLWRRSVDGLKPLLDDPVITVKDAAGYQCPDIVDRLIEDGEEGLRDGRGFFDFPEAGRSAYRESVLQRTAAMATMLRELPEPGVESSERFRRAG